MEELIKLIFVVVIIVVGFIICVIVTFNALQQKSTAHKMIQDLRLQTDDTEEARVLRSQLMAYKDQLAEAEQRILQGDIAKRFLEEKPTLEAERKALEEAIASKSREMSDLIEKQGQVDQLAREIANMESELALLNKEQERMLEAGKELKDVDERLKAAADKLKEMNDSIETQKKQKEELASCLNKTKNELGDLMKQKEAFQNQYDALREKVKEAEAIVKNLDNMKKLQEEISKTNQLLMKDLASIAESRKKGKVVLRQAAFSGLQSNPAFNEPQHDQQFTGETEALSALAAYVREREFDLSDRVLHAFHTSLKTSDISSLTVMAGVSGTGKSALPNIYSKALGLHMVTLAVEPRWDSPKDLLGFFNYVTNRYESTALARALFQFQGHHSDSFVPEVDLSDYMLMAMLDEMNLARIEYYFSEFLSKLEIRRSGDIRDVQHIKNIALEIFSGAKGDGDPSLGETPYDEPPINLFANYNTLFVGTMNEDETTQSLSDKVIDRANVLYFGRPTKLVPKTALPDRLSKGMLRKSTWQSWSKFVVDSDMQPHGKFASAGDILKRLNECLASLGRPFAHRTYQAMLAYLANYPYESAGIDELKRSDFFKRPLADQIGMRIMPKLRGLDLTMHAQTLQSVNSVLVEINDLTLADAFKSAIDRQKNRSGFFQWQGMDWSHKE